MENTKTKGPLIASMFNLLIGLLIITSIALISYGSWELYKGTVSPLLSAKDNFNAGFDQLIEKLKDPQIAKQLGIDTKSGETQITNLITNFQHNHTDIFALIAQKFGGPSNAQTNLMNFLNGTLTTNGLGVTTPEHIVALHTLQTEYKDLITKMFEGMMSQVIELLKTHEGIEKLIGLKIEAFNETNLTIIKNLLNSFDAKFAEDITKPLISGGKLDINSLIKTNILPIAKGLAMYIQSSTKVLFIGLLLFVSAWPLAFTTSLVLKFTRKHSGLKGGWGSIVWSLLYPLLGFIVHPILSFTYPFRKKPITK